MCRSQTNQQKKEKQRRQRIRNIEIRKILIVSYSGKMLGNKIKSASSGSDESQPIPHKKAKQSQRSSKPSNNNKLTSPFFASDSNHTQFWQKLYDIECRLSAELKTIQFLSSQISAVYNPIEYASDLHCAYLQKFLNAPKLVLFIGMNPGPFGMCQTGVTFLIR